jgi:FG-GAP-like repeat
MRRARASLAAALALLAASCGSKSPSNGYAVDLTMIIDSSIPDGDVARIKAAVLDVTGAETFTKTFDVTDQFAHREGRLIYRPGASGGSLVFGVVVTDGAGDYIGSGTSASVTLVPGGTVTATVTIGKGTPPLDMTMGDTAGPIDMAHADTAAANDLAMPDMAVPKDLALPNDLAVPNDLKLPNDLVMPDLKLPNDLAVPPDLSVPKDLAVPPDLTAPPDLVPAPLFVLPPIYVPTATEPVSVRALESRVDGKIDLVVANFTGNSVQSFVNNGNAAFVLQQTLMVGNGPYALQVAPINLNANNLLGVVVASINSSTMTPLVNRGDGTFAVGVAGMTGTNPTSIATGLINVDAKPDVVTGNNNSANFTVFQGNGDGTTTLVANVPVPKASIAVAVGDLNGDGKDDVVAGGGQNGISVHLGRGDFTFNAPVTYNGGVLYRHLVAFDYDKDGDADVIGADSNADSVMIFPNTGLGNFAAPMPFPAGPQAWFVHPLDVNGDSRPDLVVANRTGDGISILLNMGNQFAPPLDIPLDKNKPMPGASAIAIGDFNQDGKIDLAIACYAGNYVAILLHN